MARLVQADRKATVAQNTFNLEADGLRQQKTTPGVLKNCKLRLQFTCSPKLDNKRLDKRCLV